MTLYINKMEIRGLDLMAIRLAKIYETDQGWAQFVASPGKLAALAHNVFKTLVPFSMHPPPPPGIGLPGRPHFKPPPKSDGMDQAQRIAIYTKEKVHFAGPILDSDKVVFRPVIVLETIVGWLGISRMKQIRHHMDAAGISRELKRFYMVAFFVFLITSLVSFYLSLRFLRPVKDLADGTRALARFDFSARITVTSRDELGCLARDFNAMADTIQSYEAMQKQWVLDISHELRIPLSILKGEIEAMLDGVRPTNPAGIRALLTEIHALERLVGDLHFLSQEDARSLEMKKELVYPLLILHDVAIRFESRLMNAGIRVDNRLSLENRLGISGNKERLAQLFSNILENCLKYTETPGCLTLSLKKQGDSLIIDIDDSGPGVPESSLPHLFDRLYRVDRARTRENKGTGLGLSICKTIVRAHKGDIRAENIPGSGLRISISLPLEENL
nr:ATP-binding protein [uncultured Desulfobacter sp.]